MRFIIYTVNLMGSNEYTIENNKLKIYSYIVTLNDLNEKLELYNCNLDEMLKAEANEIEYELEQKIDLTEIDVNEEIEEITEDEIDNFLNIKKENKIDEETEKIFDEVLNDYDSPF